MALTVRKREVSRVEAFLAAEKRLADDVPVWGIQHKGDKDANHRNLQAYTMTWPVVDGLGIRQAELRFRCNMLKPDQPSVFLFMQDKVVSRVDVVSGEECKYNPPWAATLGCDATVCGPHEHAWTDNKDHLLRGGPWELPCRRPLPPNIRRLNQVLPWLADRLNVALCDRWRDVDLAPAADLFSRP